MKVAIYSGEIPSTTFIELLIRGMSRKDVRIYLFGKKKRHVDYDHPGIKIYPTPRGHSSLIIFAMLQLFRLFFTDRKSFQKLMYAIEKKSFKSLGSKIRFLVNILPIVVHRPDILHVQWVKDSVDLVMLKEIYPLKIIVSLRGNQLDISPVVDRELAKEYRKTFPSIDAFHAVSHAIANEALQYGLDLQKTTVIKPAVNKQLLKTVEPKKAGLHIISIGRSAWKKGYIFALDAMKLLKESGVDFHYTIVSQGDNEEIIYQVHDLQLQEYVSIIHGLPHDKVLQQVARANLFLLPSVEEGIANVVLEAMALGTFVITTDCGGMAEVVQDDINGFMVPLRDSRAIAEAVRRFVAASDTKKETMIQKARKTIEENHLLDKQIQDMYQLYRKVYGAV